MNALSLIIWIVLLGCAAWLAYKTGIPPLFKTLVYVVCGTIAVYLVLNAFGVLDALRSAKVPKVGK